MSRSDAHLIGIKDKSSDVAMSLAFDVGDSFWCRDTSDNDISLLFKFDNQREAQRVITAQHDLKGLSVVNTNEQQYTPTTCLFSGVTVVDLSLLLR